MFAPELDGLDRATVRRSYNGYRWLGDHAVYNPFDILLLFRNRDFEAYWFETAMPTFQIETLAAQGVRSVDLDGMVASASLLSTGTPSSGLTSTMRSSETDPSIRSGRRSLPTSMTERRELPRPSLMDACERHRVESQ